MSTATERATETSYEDQKPIKQEGVENVQSDEVDRQRMESSLVEYLQGLFDLESLRHNSYLIHRLNRNLELHPSVIHSERHVLSICRDPALIDAALEKVKGIEYQSGSLIKLKSNSSRKTVIIKSISRVDEQQFKTFIDSFLAEQNVECQVSYEPKTETFSLTFADEASAVQCFSLLLSAKFNQKNIDCILKEENLYLELVEGIQSKKPQYQYPQYGQYPYASGYGYSSQPMPMYFMQYPGQILGHNYIRKSKESYRTSNNDVSGRPSNSTYESNDQSPTGSPTKHFSRSYGQFRGNGQYYNQRNGSGYRSNKTYYQKKSYDNEPRGEEDEYEQQPYEQNEDNERTYKNQYRGSRDGEDRYYGQKRGEYKDRGYKNPRDYKKGPSEAEIEKLTKVDLDNYPPLA